ncbi:uncharacterized protein HD556DRAFT_1314785 [Suillus plorans]|uniref:Uncharacterized protein n=1 Tax=Suillus plorans TaxID=116603 RepID=A0A9P7A9C8_9AGAM|nr:uncharacterized protein HD556DRAFT_1314785 [Suillus plorans]KAG1784822.1 hypothetical protein HD556DRAFT_1314785 [Suillus plorans]
MVDCRLVYANLPCKNERLYLLGDANVLIERAGPNLRPASASINSLLERLISLRMKAGIFQTTGMYLSSERAGNTDHNGETKHETKQESEHLPKNNNAFINNPWEEVFALRTSRAQGLIMTSYILHTYHCNWVSLHRAAGFLHAVGTKLKNIETAQPALFHLDASYQTQPERSAHQDLNDGLGIVPMRDGPFARN